MQKNLTKDQIRELAKSIAERGPGEPMYEKIEDALLRAIVRWYSPDQRPDYNEDNITMSVVVLAEWDDGNTAEVWFDFELDLWMWDAKSDPVEYWGSDFEWTYLPKRNIKP